MPKVMPVFLIPYRQRQDLIEKLKSCGLNSWENFIDDNPYSGRASCYLKTEGTLLRSELDEIDGNYVYKLFYNDMQIAETKMDPRYWYARLTSQVSHLDDLPKNLLKDEETLEKELELEAKQEDLIVALGEKTPNEYTKNHLKFLGINGSEFYFDHEQHQYMLKLSKKNGFSCTKKIDVQVHPKMIYQLKYHGCEFASIHEDYLGTAIGFLFGSTRFMVDVVNLALARKDLSNLIQIPEIYSYKEDGVIRVMASGTVESCLPILQHNGCHEFYLQYQCHQQKFAEQFNYRLFDSSKAQLLVSALKNNYNIEKINLMDVHISKDDFIKLIDILANKPSFKELNLGNSYFHFSNSEFEEITKKIKGFKLISAGSSFLEVIKEAKDNTTTKFGAYLRSCMIDKADNLVSVNWHATGFYAIKEKLIPFEFPFKQIIENSKELYEIYRAFEEIEYHKISFSDKKQYKAAHEDFIEIITDIAERLPEQSIEIQLLDKEIQVLNKIKELFIQNGVNFELEESAIGSRFTSKN